MNKRLFQLFLLLQISFSSFLFSTVSVKAGDVGSALPPALPSGCFRKPLDVSAGFCNIDAGEQSCGGNICCDDGTKCFEVLGITCTGGGIKTAIGCLPFNNTNELSTFLLRWALGVVGGIAILLIINAGIKIKTSTGDPKRLQAGKELLSSAIAGVMLVIFAIFILRLVGVDILGIL